MKKERKKERKKKKKKERNTGKICPPTYYVGRPNKRGTCHNVTHMTLLWQFSGRRVWHGIYQRRVDSKHQAVMTSMEWMCQVGRFEALTVMTQQPMRAPA